VLNVSFCSKNSLEKVDTNHNLIFNAVVKLSFSQSVMVSVAVSKPGKTDLVFVQPGAKINSDHYCHNVLKQGLLPDIRCSWNDNFLFQQDAAPAHRSRHTIAYLRSHVPEFH